MLTLYHEEKQERHPSLSYEQIFLQHVEGMIENFNPYVQLFMSLREWLGSTKEPPSIV